MIPATTAFGNTDFLLGMTGASKGGVYLSGDYGSHWTQVNQGFDPNSLNINTLAKTSCSGCPVQYYSGTYGSGVYTRTIAVVNPPVISGWCTGPACACAAAAPSGPVPGGQPFTVCGSLFQAQALVSFGGADSPPCSFVSAAQLNCVTPAHIAGSVPFNVRNPDTRASAAAGQLYTYTAAASRTGNTLRVAKSGVNAALSWTCGACGSNPVQVFRSQNAAYSLNVENFYGGVGSSCTDPNALAAWANGTYFWTVE
jgi:hypothetical protein